MITGKQYESYFQKVNEKAAPCWHCKKEVCKTDLTPYYKIIKTHNVPLKTHYYIYFHAECFLEIAGDEYMIESMQFDKHKLGKDEALAAISDAIWNSPVPSWAGDGSPIPSSGQCEWDDKMRKK